MSVPASSIGLTFSCRRGLMTGFCAVWCAVLFAVGIVASIPPQFTAESFINSTWVLCNTTEITVVRLVDGGCSGDTLVTAVVNNSFLDLGWDFVQISPSVALLHSSSPDAHYYSGYLEGYLTAQRINEVMQAFNATAAATPANQLEWVEEHVTFMVEQARQNRDSDVFWAKVHDLLRQIEGIASGYEQAFWQAKNTTRSIPWYSFLDIFLLNFAPELSDVAGALDDKVEMKRSLLHCSGLIKVTATDMFTAHASWSSYLYMVRQYKIYDFNTTVAFSSAAGSIASGDDWYITSRRLATLETTNGFYNASLNSLITPASVSEFLRGMVANYLASDGREWVDYFSQYNSGTYNNQWMVVDYNRYTPGQAAATLPSGVLWIAEQIPGSITSGDETGVLRTTSYWASYNTPYFKNVYDVSGFAAEYHEWGSLFSYTQYARPEMFLRNNSDVVDLQSVQRIMRYNNWQSDPLSAIPNCSYCSPSTNPMLAIASRGDLVGSDFILPTNPEYASFFEGSAFGAVDAKITSSAMLSNAMQGSVICGPTTDQQKPFRWSSYLPGGAPPGSPDLYNFSWTEFSHVTLR